MKKIYISGKITGLDEEATRERFSEVEKLWQGKGYDVVNPFDIYDEIKEKCKPAIPKWGYIMSLDILNLNFCNTIYMLKGWEDSPGAKMEWNFAVEIGLEVIYE